MSDEARTIEEYIERYARDYCGGDIEKAKKHITVKLVAYEKGDMIEETNERPEHPEAG